MVGVLAAVVPFAEGRAGVAGGVERVGDRLFVEVQSLGARAHAMHAAAGIIAAGEELSPGRRTDRADEEAIEEYAVARQAVQVGRCQVLVAVDADIAPALIVGKYHYYVRQAAQIRA